MNRHHVLSVLVENKAGVLARVAGLFSRRGYNIFSLAVAPTSEGFSRITIVVDVDSAPLEQIIGQLNKLINVVEISELSPQDATERELLLAAVNVSQSERAQVIELVGVYRGEVVDVADDRISVMVAGTPQALDDFERLLSAYSLADLQRTGRVALRKLANSAH